MIVVNLYNQIFKTMAYDIDLLSLLGLYTNIENLTDEDRIDRNEHIQKRRKPSNILESLPLIAFYTPGGGAERRNMAVYNATFVFDIYTQDKVELAHSISERLCYLFENKLNTFCGVENFTTKLVEAYESDSNLENTFCFTLVLEFSISLE